MFIVRLGFDHAIAGERADKPSLRPSINVFCYVPGRVQLQATPESRGAARPRRTKLSWLLRVDVRRSLTGQERPVE
jgi:hypothetical protein